MTARTQQEFQNFANIALVDTYRDMESYFHLRESARLHVADGMISNLTMDQLTPRCLHLTATLPNSVAGCFQRGLYDAFEVDYLASDSRLYADTHPTNDRSLIMLRRGGLGEVVYQASLDMAVAAGVSLSFGLETEILNWLVENRYIRRGSERNAAVTTFLNGLKGATLTWKTGSGMISSNGEEIRLVRANTENYQTAFEDELKIHSAIPPDSSRSQVLFEIDTTSSYRVKSAQMIAQSFRGSEASEVVGGDIKDNFTGEGNIYTMTYGVWVDAQNAVLTEAAGETANRRFKYLAITFEKNPSA